MSLRLTDMKFFTILSLTLAVAAAPVRMQILVAEDKSSQLIHQTIEKARSEASEAIPFYPKQLMRRAEAAEA